jgi:hypothetical protein
LNASGGLLLIEVKQAISCHFLAVVLLCGCVTHTQIFQGRIQNLNGDGWTEEGTRAIGGLRTEMDKDGRRYLALSLDPEATFVLSHPTVAPTTSMLMKESDLRAWIIRHSGAGPLCPVKTPLANEIAGESAVALKGPMEFRWHNTGNFLLSVNLISDEPSPALLDGEFKTVRQREFDPNWIWMAPVIWTGLGPVVNKIGTIRSSDLEKFTQRGTLASIEDHVQRIMKRRKKHRGFTVRIQATRESLELTSQTTLLDRPGIQVSHFVAKNRYDLEERLQRLSRDTRIRFRIFPIEEGEKVLVADIYGRPSAVAEKVKAILRQAFDADDSTVLEFIRFD